MTCIALLWHWQRVSSRTGSKPLTYRVELAATRRGVQMQQCLAESGAFAMASSPRMPISAHYVASVRCALTKLSSCARALVL